MYLFSCAYHHDSQGFRSCISIQTGSDDQSWHVDGDHLFPHIQLPPHAVTVFIPLQEVTPALGSPQFLTSTQIAANASESKDDLVCVQFPLELNDLVMFDYRIVHRGMANVHPTQYRPLLYQVYSKPWFGDVVNFGSESV
eukprot:m.23515 g.23515  ORF g.23515 m.23515 type:complete len:140 (+) comp9511_c0_seq1:128-547(+)